MLVEVVDNNINNSSTNTKNKTSNLQGLNKINNYKIIFSNNNLKNNLFEVNNSNTNKVIKKNNKCLKINNKTS